MEVDVSSIRKEAETLKACNSMFIVGYQGVYTKGKELWIVMEYCHCGSLGALIRNGNQLNVTALRDIMACSLMGLTYLHAKRIIHRDIKPDNLFLSEQGVIKVGDFGLAAQLNSSASRRSVVCGTSLYMAPEVFQEQTCLVSDIWSLGISAIELAEGKPPFGNCSQYSLIQKICFQDPPSLSSSKWPSDFVDFHPFVKDAVERIGRDGKSKCLLKLSEKQARMIGGSNPFTASVNVTPMSVNVMPMSVNETPMSMDEPPMSVNMMPMSVMNVPAMKKSATNTPAMKKSAMNSPAMKKSATNTSAMKKSVDVEMKTLEGSGKTKVIRENEDLFDIEEDVETILFSDNVCNDSGITKWEVLDLKNLKVLKIGNNCLQHVSSFTLKSMKKLKRVEIGVSCFANEGNAFEVIDCPKLKSVQIGDGSCRNWTEMDMKNLNALNELSVGESCFTKGIQFFLADLPHLQTVAIGLGSFEGEEGRDGRFVLQNVEELREFKAKMRCFRFAREVTIENVPSLKVLKLAMAFSLSVSGTIKSEE
ncbi:hypothetical protein WA577_002901 [Blastocystis sp. JDR]